MVILLESWDDDETPDVTMYVAELLEGAAVPTAVNITGKDITVKLWQKGILVQTITGTTIVDGPNGAFKFARNQPTPIPAGTYGVAIQVLSPKRTYPSSKILPKWIIHSKGEAA